MSLSPSLRPAAATIELGVSGYRFGDLHDPDRLASLYERFCEEVEAADPALWRQWAAYQSAPDAACPPMPLSNLLVAMASHVSRFVTRLFDVRPRVDALAAMTRNQDALFRFKVDFVRRRVLPLVKGGARIASTAADEKAVAACVARLSAPPESREDPELAVARAGCALMDIERAGSDDVRVTIDSLKRWCAVRLLDPAYRGWVVFRFPERLDYWRLVDVRRPRPEMIECGSAPTIGCGAATASR